MASPYAQIVDRLPVRYRHRETIRLDDRGGTLVVFDTGLRSARAILKFRKLVSDESARAFGVRVAKLRELRSAFLEAPYSFGTMRGPDAERTGYTVRAFVPGVALSDIKLPLTEQLALLIVEQLANGLRSLHRAGLAHGDLKPENIIVRHAVGKTIDQHARCVIIDCEFRDVLAKHSAIADDVSLQYMAPEIAHGDACRPASDFFSLGVILYRVLTGLAPYPGDSVAAILHAQRVGGLSPIALHRPDVSHQTARLITRLTQPNPEHRAQDADEVVELARAALRARSVGDPLLPVDDKWTGGFVGRTEERDRCMREIVGGDSGRRSGALYVVADSGEGLTSFLRELQDHAESQGVCVLTASPYAVSGQLLHRQLSLDVSDIIRSTLPAKPAAQMAHQESEGEERTASILDDIGRAAERVRLAVFIDDVNRCNGQEAAFLSRLKAQCSGNGTGYASRSRGLVLVCGLSRRHDMSQPGPVEWLGSANQEVRLLPLSESDVHLMARALDEGIRLPASIARSISQRWGRRPREVAKAIRAFGSQGSSVQGGEGGGPQAAESECGVSGYPPSDDAPAGEITRWRLALGELEMHGDPRLAAECTDQLRRISSRLGIEAECPELCAVTSEMEGPGAQAATHRNSAWANWVARNVTVRRIAESLLKAGLAIQKPVSSVTYARMVLGATTGVGAVPASLRWSVVRALVMLGRAGYWGEVDLWAKRIAPDTLRALPTCKLVLEGIAVECGNAELNSAEKGSSKELSTTQWALATYFRARALAKQRLHEGARKWLGLVRERLQSLPAWLAKSVTEEWGAIEADLGVPSRVAEKEIQGHMAHERLRQRKGIYESWGLAKGRLRKARLLCSLLRVRARRYQATEKYEAAVSCYRREQAIRHIVLADGSGEAAALNNEGVVLLLAGRAPEAQRRLDACCRAREELDDERGLVAALNNLSVALSRQGEFGHAAAVLRRARSVAERNGLQGHARVCDLNAGIAYASNGQLRAARRVFYRAGRTAEEKGDGELAARAWTNYAQILADQWYPGPALRALEHAVTIPCERRRAVTVATIWKTRAQIANMLGDVATLRELVERASTDGIGEVDAALYQLSVSASRAEVEALRARLSSGKTSSSREVRLWLRRVTRRSSLEHRPHSLERLIKYCRRHGLRREGLTWAIEATRAAVTTGVGGVSDVLDVALRLLADPRFEEGHDDLHIELRALVAAGLKRRARSREAAGVLRGAISRFEFLEARLTRLTPCGGEGVLTKLRSQLEAALGARSKTRSTKATHSDALRSAAYSEMSGRGASETAGGVGKCDVVAQEVWELVTSHRGPGSASVAEVIESMLQLVLAETGAESVALAVKTKEGAKLAGYRSREEASGKDVSTGVSLGVIVETIDRGEVTLCSDALASEELSGHRSVARLRLRSVICVPWKTRLGTVGAVYADHESIAGLFTTEDQRLLKMVGSLYGTLADLEELSATVERSEGHIAQLRAEVIRSERSHVIGQVAAGIVHDVKNVLAAIDARAQLIRRSIDRADVRNGLSLIEDAARGVAGLLQRLQSCGRDHGRESSEGVDLASVVQEAFELVRPRLEARLPRLGKRIVTEVSGDRTLRATGTTDELRELFLNLSVNACDAMPEGGRISVVIGQGASGDTVVTTFRDSGVGMTPETVRRAFEPFYTTKGDRGTGLGLSIVQSIVTRLGGSVSVESAVGAGTSFTVELPRWRPNRRDDGRDSANRRSGSDVLLDDAGGGGRGTSGRARDD